MKQFATQGIILSRTDFGEADKILTFITPDHGKAKAIAKGVRKAGAKLAGAVELFSVSDITLVEGRGDIHTLISARLVKHYGDITKNIDRTNQAYDFLKILNRATEDKAEEGYFGIINQSLAALDDKEIEVEITELWFMMQLLKISGHAPNFKTNGRGKPLEESKSYSFDIDNMRFAPSKSGKYNVNQVKFLRLGFSASSPLHLQKVQGAPELASQTTALLGSVLAQFVRL